MSELGKIDDQEFDRIGRHLLRVAALSDPEIATLVSNDLLYARIKAAIKLQKQEANSLSSILLRMSRYLLPTLAALALITIGLAWHSAAPTPTDDPFNAPPQYLLTSAATCSVANKAECQISHDDVLATVFSDER